jgi:hypothetical protein
LICEGKFTRRSAAEHTGTVSYFPEPHHSAKR